MFSLARSCWDWWEHFCGYVVHCFINVASEGKLYSCVRFSTLVTLSTAKWLQYWKSLKQLIAFQDSMPMKITGDPSLHGNWLVCKNEPSNPRDLYIRKWYLTEPFLYGVKYIRISTGLDQRLDCCWPFQYKEHLIILLVIRENSLENFHGS